MNAIIRPHIVESLADPVGRIWKDLQNKSDGLFYVASPLSSTPLPIYQWIIDHANEFAQWNKMRFVLMDELVEKKNSGYAYISPDDTASYERFAKEKFLNPLQNKISTFKREVIKPDLTTISTFDTPLDLLILALGIEGNYANIMPGTALNTSWYIEILLPEYVTAHTQQGSNSFEGATFTNYGMSLGHQQVLQAKNIIVIISGEKKRDLTKELLSYKDFTPAFPLSIIYHPQVRNKVQIFITQDVLKKTLVAL